MSALLTSTDNLLVYGLTGSGKTTQLAELIKVLMPALTGHPLVYIIDRGGRAPLEALNVEQEVYPYPSDPFVWMDHAVQGQRRVNGKWVKDAGAGLVAYESLTGMGDLTLNALGHQVADGKGLDAMKAPSLTIQAEGYAIKVPSNSPTHYGMAQKHLLEKVWQSQSLGVPVVWTAHEDVAVPSKRDDQGQLRPEVAVDIGVQGMIGPLVAGHALTMHLAKYFVYTFRLKQEVKPTGCQHVLFTRRHRDGLYEGLANCRAPLGVTVPERIVPANVAQVLQLVRGVR